VNLRPVTDDDVFRIWRWQQHPDTRLFFRKLAHPTWAEHVYWFAERLNGLQQGVEAWDIIGYAPDGADVGVVNVSVEDDKRMLGIIVAPEHRGKGVGTEAIVAATLKYGGRDKLYAVIHAGNKASLGAFRRAGYKERPELRSGSWLMLVSS
jgi:RimJ/RimL family protein N-acetyltransferase